MYRAVRVLVSTGFVTLMAIAGSIAFAQAPSLATSNSVSMHDLSGYWELGPDGRSVPPAQLVPAVTKAKLQQIQEADFISQRWCRPLGLPAEMAVSRPLSITQGKDEVAITFEANASARHLYFRDHHVDPDIFDPTSVGQSIAHWDGDTLVVDTIGFHAKNGRMMIPGGGYRTAKSHLQERFKLLKNGQVLSVTSTWTDPSVFAQPQTYEYRYTRVRGMYEPRPPIGCDPYDEDQAQFIERAVPSAFGKAAEAAAAATNMGEGYTKELPPDRRPAPATTPAP
jgi:hypothetical protein